MDTPCSLPCTCTLITSAPQHFTKHPRRPLDLPCYVNYVIHSGNTERISSLFRPKAWFACKLAKSDPRESHVEINPRCHQYPSQIRRFIVQGRDLTFLSLRQSRVPSRSLVPSASDTPAAQMGACNGSLRQLFHYVPSQMRALVVQERCPSNLGEHI